MHAVTNSDDQTLRVAQLAAALGNHSGGYFKPEEIAADAQALIRAADENRRKRADGQKSFDATKLIIDLADKHGTHPKFNRRRMIEGLMIKDAVIAIP